MLEKNLGLEIAGEKPEDILVEMGRIFVDEFGFAREVKVEDQGNVHIVTLEGAVGSPEFSQLRASGVEKLFSHPFLCAGLAALKRLGVKSRAEIEIDVPNSRQVIRYEFL